MSAILDAVSAPPLAQPPAGVALICDHAMTVSAIAEGGAPGACEAEIYAAVAAAILRHTRFAVVLHRRAGSGKAVAGAAIEPSAGRLPSAPGRLQVIAAAPLESLLPGADLLVSFASPGLIAGCRSGLKPVQIGRAVIGSAAFSHVFPDIASFADALAAGDLVGRLSLPEYEGFEEFCRRITGRTSRRRLARDPILRECRHSEAALARAMRTLSATIANPFAAWRLLRASFSATATR